MKLIAAVPLIVLACLCQLALSQQSISSSDAMRPQPATGAANSASSQQSSHNLVEFDRRVARLSHIVRDMQQQLDAIQRMSDSPERWRVLKDHEHALLAAIDGLRELWAPGLMGCCGTAPPAEERMGSRMLGGPMMGGLTNWRSAGSYYSNLTPEQLKQRQYMTDQYLAMQQQIMSHMMWHQHWLNRALMPAPARAR